MTLIQKVLYTCIFFNFKVQVIEEDRSTRSGLFPTGYPNAEHPPLCTTDFFAQDQGMCFFKSLFGTPTTF